MAGASIAAFPYRRISLHDAISEGDTVVLRWSIIGTQTGDRMGIAPTGKHATITGVGSFRLSCGKIAEMWHDVD